MKFQDIYNLAVEMGMNADPRGRAGAEKALAAAQKAYAKLDAKEQAFFDIDALTNPYADSRILCGDTEAEITKMVVGIDIEPAELLLAEALNQRGAGINLVMSHHPEGRALAALNEVMWLQPGAWPFCKRKRRCAYLMSMHGDVWKVLSKGAKLFRLFFRFSGKAAEVGISLSIAI